MTKKLKKLFGIRTRYYEYGCRIQPSIYVYNLEAYFLPGDEDYYEKYITTRNELLDPMIINLIKTNESHRHLLPFILLRTWKE